MRIGGISWLVAIIGLALVAGRVSAQVPEGAALGTQEDHPTLTLPEPPRIGSIFWSRCFLTWSLPRSGSSTATA